MKKMLVVLVVVALAVVSATAAFATVAGSKHDLTSGATNSVFAVSASISACQFCHTPHNGDTIAVLWNRSLSGASYQLYGGGSTISNQAVGQPGPNSQVCLSCHDGTVSVGVVLVGADQTGKIADVTNRVSGGKLVSTGAPVDYLIGTDLRNDHPVGVTYNTNHQLRAVAGTGSNPLIIAGDTNKRWQIYGGATGSVECGSCHDPHNTAANQTPFLKGTSSSICTDCHTK